MLSEIMKDKLSFEVLIKMIQFNAILRPVPGSLMSKEVFKNIKDTDSSSQCLKVYYFNPRLGEEQIRQTSKEENNFQLQLQ